MTREQRETIEARAYNDCAREMAADGVDMSHAQADALGEEALAWLSSRLGLRVIETDEGVEAEPEVA